MLNLYSFVTPWCYYSSYSISTVASAVLIQWLLQYKLISKEDSVFCFWRLDYLKSIGKFEFVHSCALWTMKLSLKFHRIYWNWIRPHFQKRKCSSQPVQQVCKSVKIRKLGKYLFQGTKYSYVTQFPDKSSSFLLKPLAIFEIPYLLPSWDLVCACQPHQSARFIDH
jgi:hypothetical protein